MPDLPHLILRRVEIEPPRKKVGYGNPPSRDYWRHGPQLTAQVNDVVGRFRRKQLPQGVNPNLILRVQLDPKSMVDEASWERCGLTLLSVDERKTLILFSSDEDLVDFRRRLIEYREGPRRENQKSAPHSAIFSSIEEIGEVRPEDRIGRLFRFQGITVLSHFLSEEDYIVDIEVWDLGTRELCQERLNEISEFISARGGRVTDRYIGESLILLRATCRGDLIREILEIDYVASVDLPPQPTLTVGEILDLGRAEFPEAPSPPTGAPAIAVLDSGVASAHPFLTPAVGEATAVPLSLGVATDEHGHGTKVAGLALYGDVEACINVRSFLPQLTLYSARVLNRNCKFDDEHLITSQMRAAIEYFYNNYGCRVFNISLGDERLPYAGGKVGPWASILDTLSRELNIVMVVSAGNRTYDPGPANSPDGHVQHYPGYLLDHDARVIEPATGAIVLTVGALAQRANVPPGSGTSSVSFRPIALPGQPSPFTRSGPGLGGAIKPELSDFGGNYVYDGAIQTVRDNVRELSVVSFNRDYLTRLFTTDVGTSFAAPRVAHAAARLLEDFPNASANLIRALLVASAEVPQESLQILKPLGEEAILRVCGYGQPNLEYAKASDRNRVVLYAESQIAFDNFHIYEIPIPYELISGNEARSISVALAFDPPVRHSRFDYLGVRMSFRLIRGKTLEEIAEAFRQRSKDEEPVERLSSTTYDCGMTPKPGVREGSTLQMATFTMRRPPRTDYGDTFYLVVRCEKKWAKDEHAPQRYAVVVVVKHSSYVNIYNTIRERVAIRIRPR